MIKAHENLPPENFRIPPGIHFETVCLASGLLATGQCPRIITDVFTEETLPQAFCDLHPSDELPDTTTRVLFKEIQQRPEKKEGILF
jgi:membrane carboxypeptidase/penicillin-binding protein